MVLHMSSRHTRVRFTWETTPAGLLQTWSSTEYMHFNMAERLWCTKVWLRWTSAAAVCAVGSSMSLLAVSFPFGGRAWGPVYLDPAKACDVDWRRRGVVCGVASCRSTRVSVGRGVTVRRGLSDVVSRLAGDGGVVGGGCRRCGEPTVVPVGGPCRLVGAWTVDACHR